MKHIKIIIGLTLLIFSPLTAFALTATWQATSTDKGYIAPTAINGNVPYLSFPFASTTATSTMAGINLPSGGCFAINGSCLSTGGGGSGTVGSGTTGQFPFYNANGTALTATSSIFVTQAGTVSVNGASVPGAVANLTVFGDHPASDQAGSLEACSLSNMLKCIYFGYDTANGFGYIQSIYKQNSYDPLILNPNGGNVSIGDAGGTPEALFQTDYQGNTGSTLGLKLTFWAGDSDLNVGDYEQIGFGYHSASLTVPQAVFGVVTSVPDGGGFTLSKDFIWATKPSTNGYNTAPIETMRLTQIGNLGIGTTSPFAALDLLSTRNNQTPLLNIASSTNGAATSSALFVSANGNVGIGTTNPVGTLSVQGASGVTPLRLTTTGAAAFSWSDTVNGNLAAFSYDPNGNPTVRALSGKGLSLGTNGSDDNLFINTSGNVGIGTTTPGTLLSLGNTGGTNISVTSTSTFATGINLTTGCLTYQGGSCIGAGGSGTVNTGTQGQFPFYNANGTALTATSSIFVTQAGNVGISNSAPTTLFQVGGTNDGNLRFVQSGGQTGEIQLYYLNESVPRISLGRDMIANGIDGFILKSTSGGTIANSGVGLGSAVAGSLDFYTSNGTALTDRGELNSSGNFGIGTTTPTARFVSVAASTTAGTVANAYQGIVAITAGLENTVTKLFQEIDQWGDLIVSGDAPTLTSCTGGSVGSNSNQRAGSITIGTGLTSCGVLFAHPYPSGVSVHVFLNEDSGTILGFDAQSISTTGFTITAASVATADVVSYTVVASQ